MNILCQLSEWKTTINERGRAAGQPSTNALFVMMETHDMCFGYVNQARMNLMMFPKSYLTLRQMIPAIVDNYGKEYGLTNDKVYDIIVAGLESKTGRKYEGERSAAAVEKFYNVNYHKNDDVVGTVFKS